MEMSAVTQWYQDGTSLSKQLQLGYLFYTLYLREPRNFRLEIAFAFMIIPTGELLAQTFLVIQITNTTDTPLILSGNN